MGYYHKAYGNAKTFLVAATLCGMSATLQSDFTSRKPHLDSLLPTMTETSKRWNKPNTNPKKTKDDRLGMVRDLLELLNGKNVTLKRMAAESLVEIVENNPENPELCIAVSSLSTMLEDKEWRGHGCLLKALEKMAKEQQFDKSFIGILPLLIREFSKLDENSRETIGNIIKTLSPRSLDAVLGGVESNDRDSRVSALWLLKEVSKEHLSDPEIKKISDVLFKALDNADPGTDWPAMSLLAELGERLTISGNRMALSYQLISFLDRCGRKEICIDGAALFLAHTENSDLRTKFVSYLIGMSRDENPASRLKSVTALGAISSGRSISDEEVITDALVACLRDDGDADVRIKTIDILASRKDALSHLRYWISNGTAAEIERAAMVVAKMAAEGLEYINLLPLLFDRLNKNLGNDADTAVAEAIRNILVSNKYYHKIGDFTPKLRKMLENKNEKVLDAAIRAVEGFEENDYLTSALFNKLDNENAESYVAYRLEEKGLPSLPQLAQMLQSGKLNKREKIMEAIIRISSEHPKDARVLAIAPLIGRIASYSEGGENYYTNQYAWNTLRDMGGPAIPSLINLTYDRNPKVVKDADMCILQIASWGDPKSPMIRLAIQPLLNQMRDPEAGAAAAHTLLEIGNASIAAVISYLSRSDEVTFDNANYAIYLFVMKDANNPALFAAVAPLLAAANSQNDKIGYDARNTLAWLSDRTSNKAIKSLIEKGLGNHECSGMTATSCRKNDP